MCQHISCHYQTRHQCFLMHYVKLHVACIHPGALDFEQTFCTAFDVSCVLLTSCNVLALVSLGKDCYMWIDSAAHGSVSAGTCE